MTTTTTATRISNVVYIHTHTHTEKTDESEPLSRTHACTHRHARRPSFFLLACTLPLPPAIAPSYTSSTSYLPLSDAPRPHDHHPSAGNDDGRPRCAHWRPPYIFSQPNVRTFSILNVLRARGLGKKNLREYNNNNNNNNNRDIYDVETLEKKKLKEKKKKKNYR